MELIGYASDAELGFRFQNETWTNTPSFFLYRAIHWNLEGLGFS